MQASRRRAASALAAGIFAPVLPLFAQDAWPSRSVRIIAPEPPGGGLDGGARAIAQVLAREFGQSFVVENMPGAANIVGTSAAVRARPDGYTLLHASQSPSVIIPLVKKDNLYKTSDLVPVSQTMSTTNTLVINPQRVTIRTVPALIALLKAHPNRINYGSSGIGGWSHLIHELFQMRTGTVMAHIPYGGASAVRTALLGGQVDLAIVSTTAVLGDIREGRLLALAVPTPQRLPEMPEVPTITESVPDFTGLRTWNGLFAPVGTPADIVTKLSAAVARAVKDPAVVEVFARMGATAAGSSPEEFARHIDREVAVWRAVIDDRKISIS